MTGSVTMNVQAPVGPLPHTLRCDCQEWMADAATLRDMALGYSFICPACRQAIKQVPSHE